jgi:hypothetical protein
MPIPDTVRAVQPHPAPTIRLSRAALATFGALAVAGCTHDSAMVSVYGGPPVERADPPADAGAVIRASHASATRGGADASARAMPATLYGTPAVGPNDVPAPAYGAPPARPANGR